MAVLLLGCAPVAAPEGTTASHGMTTVQVTATYRERILLPPGHVLTLRIEDVSLADAPARILAEHVETLDGRGPPYVATLGFHPARSIRATPMRRGPKFAIPRAACGS